MLRESGVVERLEAISGMVEGACVYEDLAYPVSRLLQVPFKGSNCTKDELNFNRRISKVMVSVEWCLGKVVSLFPFVDFRKNIKLYLQPVGTI
jgi:DDE superfamily endonuclease